MLAALFTLLPAFFTQPVDAAPCVAFDADFNLYAFGGSSDVRLGAASSWGSPSPRTLTTTGRPPWTGPNSSCHLSQYNNALYVLGADSSDLSKVYVYNFASDSWSTQSTTGGPSSLGGRSSSVLDHDTNVFFTLPGNGAGLTQLDLSSIKATASGSSLAWEGISQPSFSTSSYTPVAALASNHINYFGVPGTAAGSANIFIIHFSQFQQAAQAYPTMNGGAAFPDTAGFAATIPDAQNNAGTQMLFVPNDFSSSFIVTHWTNPGDYTSLSGAPFATSMINTTQILPAPTSQDTNSYYAASPSDIVQINSNGEIYYIAGAISSYTVNSGSNWTKMSFALTGLGGSYSTSSSSAASASASSGSGSASGSGSTSMSGGSASITGSASSAASAASGAASASRSGSGAEKGGIVRFDLIGIAMGLVALGMGLVL